MKNTYSLTPKFVKKINTKYRRIITKIPPPGAISIIKKLRKYEPRSMSGHPLVVWDRAKGFQVYDKFGNKWIDFSSGILVANAGHCCSDIQNAIIKQVRKGLLHNYCFPSEIRAILVEKLVKLMPFPLRKVFLLSTGAEAVETIIKILRTYGFKTGGKRKIGIISFSGAFHGRTLGAQMIGGISDLKKWIVNFDKNMYVSPFPNCFRCPWGKDEYNKCEEECFNNSLEFLKQQGVVFSKIAGVLTETYQGAGATFIPKKFVQLLQKFCKKHKILLAFDEVQAGFGRTGKMFGFEHYGVVPDITCFGKGITSSLPLSVVIGRQDVMDICDTGTMTSTHTGNPVCIAAAIANIDYFIKNNLVKHAAYTGKILYNELEKIKCEFPERIGCIQGKGLVYGVHIVKKDSKEPDGNLAFKIVSKCIEKGLLFFSPVGFGGATIKIAPPLVITKDAVKEGASVLREAISELV